ncbi:MAG: glycosyltransferase family 39 protein, partial [Thermoanaerobaculia bacterium]
GDVSTHLVQLLAALVTALLLIEWGRRSFSPAAGWLAAAAFLGNPIVVYLAGTAYVEPLLTLFITAAVYALERWRDSQETAWLALAALFAGSAAGVKYLGLFFVGAVFLAALPAAVRGRRWRDLAIAAAVALAVLAPTYGRILSYTGNPLFPFYPEVFGSGLWDPQSGPSRTLEVRVVEYLRIPWAVLFDRRSVGWQPPYSPAYLLAAPLLAVGFVRDPRVRRFLGFALGYSLLFPILPPDSRYLAVVLPLVSLALAVSLTRWRLRMLPAVAALLFLPGWLYALYGIHREGPLPASPGEREAYLRKELPAYAAVQHLDGLRGSHYVAYGLFAENMVYHADGTLLGDWNGPASYRRVLPTRRDPEAFHRRLRDLGAGYLLLPRDRNPPLPDRPAWRRRFHRIYSDGKAEVYELSP